MKIGIDARFYGKEHSGLGRYTMNFLSALQKVDRENEYIILLRAEYEGKLKLASNFKPLKCNAPHYSIDEQFRVSRLIDSLGLDLFHSLHFNAPVFAHTPMVLTIHDLIKTHFTSKDTTTRSSPFFFLKRIGYNYVVGTATKKAKRIVVPSQFVKKDLIKLLNVNPRKIVVIPEAPDPVFTAPSARKPKKSDNYILFVGNAYPHKNLRVLLKAFARLSDKNVRLVIVSKDTPFLNKELGSLDNKLKKRVDVKSVINDNSLKDLYLGATAVVIPSFMEGFGLVGIEALALGVPVIASNIPVFHEVYGNKVTYFSPSDDLDLAKNISQILVSPPKPKMYHPPLDWEGIAKRVVEVYHEASSGL